MSGSEIEDGPLRQLLTDAILGTEFRRATFGGTARRGKHCPWVRVLIRPVELRGHEHVQFAYFDAKKNVTRNFRGPALASALNELLNVGFSRVHLSTRTEEVDVRTTKKGKVLIGRRSADPVAPEPRQTHNRMKDVPLPEGRADRLLEALGILTRAGHVRATMRAKYTQINEFLKHLTHVLADAGLRSVGRELTILDCACGSSYLTLAVHHYLNDVLGIPARIMGVDVNDELIRKSIERSERVGAERLQFVCGRIGTVDTKPDIVLALHACDTATDDAIAQASAAEAKLLLSVPCCHHDLNDKLRAVGPAAVLRPLLRHGLLHERTADLVTDAFRALALRIMGYRTDVVEFISAEHTARNLMIRAVHGLPIGDAAFVSEYVALRRFWGVTPHIEVALGERFQRIVSGTP
jgi:hypothetical protein